MSHMLSNIIEALSIINAMNKYPVYIADTEYLNLNNLAEFDECRANFFADEQSRQVFDWACKYRIISEVMGDDYYAIPGAPITLEQWRELEERVNTMTGVGVEGDYIIDRIDTWLLESYSLEGHCEVRPGDVVLDCGAHVGNTAVYFSQKTGERGHVYAFEPMPDAFTQLKKNVGHLANVSPVNSAVLKAKGIAEFSMMGAASRLAREARNYPVVPVYTVSIDEFVSMQHIENVDFIKMDIEGGETAALQGAQDTITRCKPKMAIAVYHEEMDLVSIPMLIKKILPEYSFSLRQYMHINCETVLYCYCK